ncbi:MAG: hypothetical protein GF383_11475 [Candidatus Lokiarchaeota archaeon]|nr:hypothetical protein [Candidatus Lokiarchaeota archaeon]MBD3341344.1 hypothetical protein [Candidatus Lokiarchaeota archaeon]
MENQFLQKIIIKAENCTGCRICQMICSLTHTKTVNYSNARIKIEEPYPSIPKITFTSDCVGCGECVSHCLYEALKIEESEE